MDSQIETSRRERALAIAGSGGFEMALLSGALPQRADLTLAETLVLGLLRQGVTRYVGIFGHGSTEVGDVLRVYEDAGVVHVFNVRNEVAAAHAATALRWTTGERAAVFTSIGPGALQAMAGSLAAASDGVGVWHLYGDETSEGEGPNMQQIPKHEQELFLKLASTLGDAFTLHTPGAVATALRRGYNVVNHPYRQGPFFLLMPMNTQPALIRQVNLRELPKQVDRPVASVANDAQLDEAARVLHQAQRVVVKVGFGARGAGTEIARLLELADGVAVATPIATGIVPYSNRRHMTVGGSKGSICGNWAMENADVLVAVGTRFVCQSDSSRTGYPEAERVITINPDPQTVNHYGDNIALMGDAKLTLAALCERLEPLTGKIHASPASDWLDSCSAKRRDVLTQPAAIKIATDWARANGAVSFFDAGDVQANGFQVVEDEREGQTITETGASYMGFAASALMATAMTNQPFYGLAFTGDGSFTMNPQILIDGVQHGAKGCILLLDNRRMAAISALQDAQYEQVYKTSDEVAVDYLVWAKSVAGVNAIDGGTTIQSLTAALDAAKAHNSLSLIHLPVYYGPDPLGGLGAFGRWNVGNWVKDTQRLRHHIGL